MEAENEFKNALPDPDYYKRTIRGLAISFMVLSVPLFGLGIAEMCIKDYLTKGIVFGFIGVEIGLLSSIGIMLKSNSECAFTVARLRGICISGIVTAVLLGVFIIGQVVRIILILIVHPEEGNEKPDSPYILMGCFMVIELVFICILFCLATFLAVVTGNNLREK